MNPDSSPKTLTRSSSDRQLGGVCGGLAAYFNLDATLVRVGFLLTTAFTGGAALLAYAAMLVVVPADDRGNAPLPV